MKTTKLIVVFVNVLMYAHLSLAAGRLVARWDFNDFDADAPASAAILAPTIGTAPAVPCAGNGSSAAVTDGTLGAITVINAATVGNGRENDYALVLPPGSHLKIPFPSTSWAQEKTWMLRLRFCSPSASTKKTRALLQADVKNEEPTFFFVDASNFLMGDTGVFGIAAEENGTGKPAVEKTRTVTDNTWSELDFYFAPDGVATFFDGKRTVSTSSLTDGRMYFTGDGLLIGAGPENGDASIYVTTVELWEDVACYHVTGGYLQTTLAKLLTDVSLANLRDLFFSCRRLGSWGDYSTYFGGCDRIVTSSGDVVSNLKVEMNDGSGQAIRAEFRPSGSDVTGASAKMCWGLGWPVCYWTDVGGDTSGGSYQVAGTTWNYNGYSPYNVYATELNPLLSSQGWRFFMGHGHFGSPVISIVGNNPTLTFDRQPSADGIIFDCGRGDGAAEVTLAVVDGIDKNFSEVGDLTVRSGVSLVVPSSLVIAGKLVIESGAKVTVFPDVILTQPNTVVFTAAEGIELPSGASLTDCVQVEGMSTTLSADGTQILASPFVPQERARLVGKWTFDNFNEEDPTSTSILEPTIGTAPAVPCTGNGSSVAVADGTLGAITVINASTVGNGRENDYALVLPAGNHLKIPFPSTNWAKEKTWMLRLRFCSPSASTKKTRALLQADVNNEAPAFFFVDASNYLTGDTEVFGTGSEENGTGKSAVEKTRTVTDNTWSELDFYFAPDGVATFFDGKRTVSTVTLSDWRTCFTGDGLLIGAGPENGDEMIYVTAVELWEDVTCHHVTGGYLPTSQTNLLANVSLVSLRDLFFSCRRLGTWGEYSTYFGGCDRIVTSSGSDVSNLKVEMNDGVNAAIRAEFRPSGSDVTGASAKMCWGLGWPVCYWTDAGGDTPGGNYQAAGTTWNYDGYSPYNVYATELNPLLSSQGWRFFMGHGHFGNPVISIVGGNPTLTFDRQPSADGIIFDCGRGDGAAEVTLAVADGVGKRLANLRDMRIRPDVTVNVPDGIEIAGALRLSEGSKFKIHFATLIKEVDHVAFTAAGGIVLPEGKSLDDCVSIDGYMLKLNNDQTQILANALVNIPMTATWTGEGDVTQSTDPANWVCYNAFGEIMSDTIPGEHTVVSISGETTFNIPAGQNVNWKQLVLNDVLLTRDCDWRGLRNAISGTVDLGGHFLQLKNLVGTVAIADKSSDSFEAGKVIVDVPEGGVVSNTTYTLSGRLRLVKTGSGTLVLAKPAQTYTGGTEVGEGTLKYATSEFPAGPFNVLVKVSAGATLDMNGCYSTSTCYYCYDLAGTVLQSVPLGWSNAERCFGDIVLSGDATIRGMNYYFSGDHSRGYGTIAFNQHTLTVYADGYVGVGAWRLAPDDAGGTICYTGSENGRFDILSDGYDLHDDTVRHVFSPTLAYFLVNRILKVGALDYQSSWWRSTQDTGAIQVFGTYKAGAMRPHLKMMSGSSIDLSEMNGPFDIDGVVITTDAHEPGRIEFDDNATVMLKFGDRHMKPGRVLAWENKPENVDDVNFILDLDMFTVDVQSDGVYIRTGLCVIIR